MMLREIPHCKRIENSDTILKFIIRSTLISQELIGAGYIRTLKKKEEVFEKYCICQCIMDAIKKP